MGEDLVDAKPGVGVPVQAASHQLPGARADAECGLVPGKLPRQDLLVRLEGDVSGEHVVQEDTQRPGGQALAWNVETMSVMSGNMWS